MIYIRDVAHVRDGFAVQQNIVRSDGVRASLLTIIKSGAASTLDIVARIKKAVPQVAKTLPPGLEIRTLLDQSLFVRAAVQSVIKEAIIAACLTAIMILIFLGNWRTTFVIVISIPLAILCSVITLSALGETMNIMTLGGLALAVGILVDDATVEIENIERNLRQGKELRTAILDGAAQIAVPAFVSTLCICIVFVPMFFLTGTARYLFVPLAEAVVFAMLASYLLSRTVVPTLVMYFLRNHVHETGTEAKGWFGRFHARFETGFERLRERLPQLAQCLPASPGAFRRLLPGFLRRLVSFDAVSRPGFFPQGGCRPDAASCPGQNRHARRGNGRFVRSR